MGAEASNINANKRNKQHIFIRTERDSYSGSDGDIAIAPPHYFAGETIRGKLFFLYTKANAPILSDFSLRFHGTETCIYDDGEYFYIYILYSIFYILYSIFYILYSILISHH